MICISQINIHLVGVFVHKATPMPSARPQSALCFTLNPARGLIESALGENKEKMKCQSFTETTKQGHDDHGQMQFFVLEGFILSF